MLLPLFGLALCAPVLAEEGPVEVLQGMSDHVLEIIKQDPSVLDDKAHLRSIADQVVIPNIDFIALSQSVLGITWRQATPEQREVFEREFRSLLMNTYLNSISRADYQGQSIKYLPLRNPPTGDRAEVDAEIEQPNGPLIHAQFRLYRRDGAGWKVYDVVVEGVSLVITQRSSFSSIIRDKGLSGLIAMLEERNNKRIDSAATKDAPSAVQ
ncbi:MAG: ABC transporter substrate-binding protein [Gammaproteobacteria bacterium]